MAMMTLCDNDTSRKERGWKKLVERQCDGNLPSLQSDVFTNICQSKPVCAKFDQIVFDWQIWTEKGCDDMTKNKDTMVECRYRDKVFYIDHDTFSKILLDASVEEKEFVRYKTGSQMFDCCERQFRTLAEDAGAVYGIGKMRFVEPKQVRAFILSSPLSTQY
ncbi:MAG: hypothetical protein IJP92_16610 [Lachnospiraceae bacterium]|nr:hypothetical protein [Lachnospiraceae bacterium]